MKNLLTLTVASVLLSGCVSASRTTGPDGGSALNISCNGGMNSMGSCYEKAAEICGRGGYEVIDKDTSSTFGGPAKRMLMVKCKRGQS